MSTVDLQFTRFTSINPKRLSKRFTRVGNTLVKESGGNMTDGIAERLTVPDLRAFAKLLTTLKPNQALSYGINGHERARVVTADALAGFYDAILEIKSRLEFPRLEARKQFAELLTSGWEARP